MKEAGVQAGHRRLALTARTVRPIYGRCLDPDEDLVIFPHRTLDVLQA
jgi:hypothetical protein